MATRTVTITGSGNSSACCVTINGTNYTSAATVTVDEGTIITCTCDTITENGSSVSSPHSFAVVGDTRIALSYNRWGSSSIEITYIPISGGGFTASLKNHTIIDGTACAITGGKVLIDGTAYDISKGRTLVDEAGYDIKFRHKVVTVTYGPDHNDNYAYIMINDTKIDTNGTYEIDVPEDIYTVTVYVGGMSQAYKSGITVNGMEMITGYNISYTFETSAGSIDAKMTRDGTANDYVWTANITAIE